MLEQDVAQAALAAVASSRRTPPTMLGTGTGGTKRRGALPREFRDGVGGDGRVSASPSLCFVFLLLLT